MNIDNNICDCNFNREVNIINGKYICTNCNKPCIDELVKHYSIQGIPNKFDIKEYVYNNPLTYGTSDKECMNKYNELS